MLERSSSYIVSTSQHSRTVLFQHQKLASPVILDRKEIAYHDSRLCFLSAQLPRKHFTIEMKPAQVCVIVTCGTTEGCCRTKDAQIVYAIHGMVDHLAKESLSREIITTL